MNYIFYDSEPQRSNLLPFTFTRPVANLRIGILTIDEKWAKHLNINSYGYLTEDYLTEKFPKKIGTENTFINGSICPTARLVREIKALKPNQSLVSGTHLIAVCLNQAEALSFEPNQTFDIQIQTLETDFIQINDCYDIFSKNGQAIEEDFAIITHGRSSQPIPDGNRVICPERIFIEAGAQINFSILNASAGPIYIGKDSDIMEGCKIRGPFALCEHAALKMGAKIYGPTTVGPYCKVGGEVNNSVFYAYSNKGHDGFMGNAVIGEWVNIGADTNNSNLKNTYDEVKLWNYRSERFEKTGLTFCGLMIADHAKCGINTMFNTGTVVGVGANVFGSGYPRNFIPDFSWGGPQGFETFVINKFYKTAEAVYKRRDVPFTEADKSILREVFNQTKKYRFWEENKDKV